MHLLLHSSRITLRFVACQLAFMLVWPLTASPAPRQVDISGDDHFIYLPFVSQDVIAFDDPQLSVHTSQIVIETYNWQDGLYWPGPGDPIYPYPRIDRNRVTSHAPMTYQTIVLENSYVRVILLPALGGRILRWEDKVTGRLLTYANPVIKPAYGWGYRGWWLATGGIEWDFPVEEHGLNEWRPWQYEMLSGPYWRGVRVYDLESRTGMTVEVTLRLYGGRSDLVITPRITNPTNTAQQFMFWINAMLTLSGQNTPAQSLHFWVPTAMMQVHSTSDSGLPPPPNVMAWPRYWYANSQWRDFSHYSEWRRYLGVFATQWQGAAGAYDDAADQGVVRSYPPAMAQGVKIFCLGEIGSAQYTDDASRYFELWGGYNHTFFTQDYATIGAAQTITWEETWYPVNGIGELVWANRALAAGLWHDGAGVQIGVYSPIPAQTQVILSKNGEVQTVWDEYIAPSSSFRTTYAGSGSGWAIQLYRYGSLIGSVSLDE